MAIRNYHSAIDKIIYDPVRGRIAHDLLISLFLTFWIYFLFWLFEKESLNFEILAYPLLFIVLNFTQGIYGRSRTTSLGNKLKILLTSNIFALIGVLIFSKVVLIPLILFTLNTLLSLLPRFFLNFNVERTTFKKFNHEVRKDSPILVVGGGGYIGSSLVEQLLKNNNKVRVFDKFIYGKEMFKGLRNVKNLELIEGDISDIYNLTLAVKDSKAIVHLAAVVGDPAAKVDEKLTRHVNIASTRLLKETAKAFGIEKFIFASSCSVYGTSNKLQTEESDPKPISLYAKSKIDSEKELLSDTTDSFHPVILRFSTVFGHSKKPRFDLVANLFTARAFYNKEIVIEGGNQWRPFIHVRDIARAIVKVLDSPNEKVSRQIFNVGDDKMNVTILDLANIIVKTIKDPRVKIKVLNKKMDKRDYRVSFNKIKNDLGFKASISIEEGIREINENLRKKMYKKPYDNPYYVNSEMTKMLKKEFRSKKYKKSHFSTIS